MQRRLPDDSEVATCGDFGQRFVEAMAEVPADVRRLRTDVDELRDDVRVIKAVVVDGSAELEDHKKRITRLERKAA